MSPPTAFRLFLFGAFRLEAGGRVVRLATRKAEALLAYLALHPEPQRREKLAALFWGETTSDRAAGSLRTALAHLRTALGAKAVHSDRQSAQLNPGWPLWVDVREMESVIAAWAGIGGQAHSAGTSTAPEFVALLPAPGEAVGNMFSQGDLLEGFYDEWVLPLREHYRALRVEGLLRLAQALRAQSEYERAIDAAEQVLVAEPANEPAYQHLIFCYLAAGDRGTALTQYERCRQALAAELGVEPLPETTALYEWIKRAEAPQGTSPAALRTNLPIPLSSFVGRRQASAALKLRLAAADSRLITLVGPGGSGKTRLAIQVATDLVLAFPEGVWWVELAGLSEPGLVIPAVARTLGVRGAANQPLMEALVAHLRARRLLLVIDNCEHVLAACIDLVKPLLEACAQLQVLATSREPLGITGEVHWPVAPLALPDSGQAPSVPGLAEVESVRLLVERAQAVQPEFVLGPANALAVRDICLRLDGIPLAIELAAARVRVLSPGQIAERLHERLGLLTTSSRAALPRHQTLRAALDWSHDLLTHEEQRLFRRLAVFAGGFDLPAAQAVAEGDVLEHLTRLVLKSLVVAVTSGEQARYRLLETMREYAWDRLRQAGEESVMRDQHLAYFLALATEVEPHLTGPNQQALLERLEREHDNLRAALDYAGATPNRAEQGLSLAGQLGRFWWTRGYYLEARERLERALAQTPVAAVTQARAKALHGLGNICHLQGDFASAPRYLEPAEQIYRAVGNYVGAASALVGLGVTAHELDKNAEAVRHYQAGLLLFRAAGDELGIAICLANLGHVAQETGDYAAARSYLQESIAIYRKVGNRQWLASSLNSLGQVARFEGDFANARAYHDQALAIRRSLDDRGRMAWSLCMLGELSYEQNDLAAARQFLEESITVFRPVGDRNGLAQALVRLGYVWLRLEDEARAVAPLAEALRLYADMGRRRGAANALSALGVTAAALGEAERAARLLGGVGALLVVLGATLPPGEQRLHEQAVTLARAQCPPAVFEAAWNDGQRLAENDGGTLVAYAHDLFG